MEIAFTSDPRKAKRNERKHGISFKTAERAFDDPFVLIVEDCEDERGEMRFHAIGRVDSQLLLLVVHADRSTDEQVIVHIISVSKADNYEQRAYSRQF